MTASEIVAAVQVRRGVVTGSAIWSFVSVSFLLLPVLVLPQNLLPHRPALALAVALLTESWPPYSW